MTKPTPEIQLNELHALVARVLKEELEREPAQIEIDGVLITPEHSVSPALLAQAIKFLKDNSITTTPEEDTNLQSLRDTLKSKSKHSSRLASVSPLQATKENK